MSPWEVVVLEEYPFNILDVANILRLTIRRELSNSVYVDCPFCRKRKGKLNLNLDMNVWRCNRCGESGHMFELYARVRGTTVTEAKLELIDLLAEGKTAEWTEAFLPETKPVQKAEKHCTVEQSPKASAEEIDRTMRAMLNMLTITPRHREHLHTVRGLRDDQIADLGLKSTPSYRLRHIIPQRLRQNGYTVAGVPGFYVDRYGKWTANFTTWTAGIIVPTRSMEGLISGAQIRLDKPIKDDPNDPEDEGTKYIWFSTSSKHMGASSGSPVNLIGDRHAHTVYITEGAFKAGITHCLTGRTVMSIQGANNLNGVKEAFLQLHDGGTQLIVEALDIDKYNNPDVAKGAQKIYLLARSCGLRCLSLTWNPNYKGIDDWQIALVRKNNRKMEGQKNFKEQFLTGTCSIAHIQAHVDRWQCLPQPRPALQKFLGLTGPEFEAYRQGETALKELLEQQKKTQRFRIYQLDSSSGKVISFAFKGVQALYEADYKLPPAAEYRLVLDGEIVTPEDQPDDGILKEITEKYSDNLPDGYPGRSIAPSDVLELYDDDDRRYFYVDQGGTFAPVRFSPALAKQV